MDKGMCGSGKTEKIDYEESMRAFKKYTEESEARETEMIEQFDTQLTDIKSEMSQLKKLLEVAVSQLENKNN